MEETRDSAANTPSTEQKEISSCRASQALPTGSRLTPLASRLALATPSKTDVDSLLLPATRREKAAAATPIVQDQDATRQSARKRRAMIFTDDSNDDDDDADADGDAQVFSVDSTVTAVETTMQPERQGICMPRVSRSASSLPLRARRVLNLMDRLEPDDANDQLPSLQGVATVREHNDQDNGDDDSILRVRRTWKRRLVATTASSPLPLSPASASASASDRAGEEGRHPPFARSYSSHSVFLAPPKLSFARSTSSPAGDETSNSSAAAQIHTLVLPTVRSRSHPDLNVIAPHTVADLLNGVYADRLDSFALIDCRFGYEFAGGSLKGAMSLTDPALVEERFLRKPPTNSSRTALIFYCEFSANRAPKMLRHVRNLDRWIHAERYPELFYPELYLIDGGYKNCYETLKDEICHPARYQTMSDKAFTEQCIKDFATHRANWKLHKSNGCASKFQQLHRHIHDVFIDDSICASRTLPGEDDVLAHPMALTLRSFSQQL